MKLLNEILLKCALIMTGVNPKMYIDIAIDVFAEKNGDVIDGDLFEMA